LKFFLQKKEKEKMHKMSKFTPDGKCVYTRQDSSYCWLTK